MDLNEISIFVKVVQAGGFGRAAEALSMPNSTVSAKVSSLEKRLGVQLLRRSTRRLNVTAEGQAFFERSLKGLDELKAAEAVATAQQHEVQGRLRLTAPTVLGASLLPEVITRFTRLYPLVQLDLVLSDERRDLLGEEIDLALRAGDLEDSTLVAKKIGVSYFAPFASRSYLKQAGYPQHPKELRAHRCLVFPPLGRNSWELVSRETPGVKARAKVVLESIHAADDLNFVKELALQGLGIALLPTFLCFEESRRKELIRVLPDWRSESRPVRFVYPAQRYTLPKVRAFIDVATEILQGRLED